MTIELAKVPVLADESIRDDQILFSESCGRFLVTVPKACAREFEGIFDGLPYGLVGEVTENPELVITGKSGKEVLRENIFSLRQSMDGKLEVLRPIELRRGSPLMENPLVGIIMGSDSDIPVMEQAVRLLEEFEIPYEMRILSAHRTPDEAAEYAKGLAGRGIKVLIAGAGWAAHLAGVAAAQTAIPVIGVPIDSSSLNGMDSLLSTVQMPPASPWPQWPSEKAAPTTRRFSPSGFFLCSIPSLPGDTLPS